MAALTIAASEVRVGDKLWNAPTVRDPKPLFPWVRVKAVEQINGQVRIRTVLWDTWKHPREGVAVQREG